MLLRMASPSNSMHTLLDAEHSKQACYLNCSLSRALSLSNSSYITCVSSVSSKTPPHPSTTRLPLPRQTARPYASAAS